MFVSLAFTDRVEGSTDKARGVSVLAVGTKIETNVCSFQKIKDCVRLGSRVILLMLLTCRYWSKVVDAKLVHKWTRGKRVTT